MSDALDALENIQEKIVLHDAKLILDANGYIYNPEVLKEIIVGSVVRIFMTLPRPPLDLWSHDSPYVSIVEVDKKSSTCLGEILDLERVDECNRYPLAVGEKIWFSLSNIIEIPIKEQSKNKEKKIKAFITNERVMATGPLYTIDYTFDDSGSDTDSDSYSDTDSD
jgi:hypothetical protein